MGRMDREWFCSVCGMGVRGSAMLDDAAGALS